MTQKNILIIVASFLAGILFFAYHHQWIIIQLPWHTITAPRGQSTITKKQITLHYWKHNKPHAESQQLLWHESDQQANAAQLINTYFSLLDEEWVINKKIVATATTLGPRLHLSGPSGSANYPAVAPTSYGGHSAGQATPANLIVSLSDSPFNPEASAAAKWHLLEGLLQTLHEQIPSIQNVIFLANHQPLMDQHLDFTNPWPVTGFIPQEKSHIAPLSSLSPLTLSRVEGSLTILLDPAGDANNPGRVIDDTFERSISFQFAQALKQEIDAYYHDIKIVVTRSPGEAVELLQQASFSNRISADMFIHIGMYQQNAPVPELMFYQFLTHPTTDFWARTSPRLSFEPYHHAHRPAALLSQQIILTIMQILERTKPLPATLGGYAAIPYKPLVGITAPAIAIEIGLHKKNDWQPLVAPMADTIIQISKLLP
jgi:N-acetylmuramoyl-L-alanine amidase